MSRNIGDILCQFCGTDNVKLTEEERFIAKIDAGIYFDEYKGMIVADAECRICKSQYLAWIDGSKREYTSLGSNHPMDNYPDRRDLPDYEFVDMSYRSTFNDEPSCVDFPIYHADGSLWYPEYDNYYFQSKIEQCFDCLNKSTIFYCINYVEPSSVGLKFVGFCDEHKNGARTDNPLWSESSFDEISTHQLLNT